MFLTELVVKLETDGVGIQGEDIFTSKLASIPQNGRSLSIVKTGGSGPEYIQENSLPAFQFQTAQLAARHTSPALAEAYAYQAYFSLCSVVNRTIGNGFYRRIKPIQEPMDLSPDDRGPKLSRFVFNIVAERRLLFADQEEDTIVGYYVVENFGGDRTGFVAPGSADVYPAGTTIDKCVPDSIIALISAAPTGASVYFESSAVLSGAGGRAKVALWNLDTNALVTELVFPNDDTVGTVERSGALTLAPNTHYGVKMTTNNPAVLSAAWGTRLIHI